MEDEIKLEAVLPVTVEELEKVFDEDGNITGVVPIRMLTREEAEKLFPSPGSGDV